MSHQDPREEAPRIRVLVAYFPGWLCELVVKLIEDQPDMQNVGQAQEYESLISALDAGVNVLVLGTRPDESPLNLCAHLLGIYQTLRIVALTTSGDAITLYWLGLRRQRLQTVSMRSLVKGIRRVDAQKPWS